VHCRKARFVAVDTESDSFHHYREKVCLVQMSACGVDALIDPLALDSLDPLASLFAEPQQIKIFHDACYDLICLRRDFGFEVRGLYDTMVASRLLGHTSFGLATMLRQRFGHEANKRLQRSDWTRRPLTDAQVSYARFDTHYLEPLATQLTRELRAAGRLTWAREEFDRLPEVARRITERVDGASSNGFWRVRGIRTLPPPILGRVRALYHAREKIAERFDRPPFKVFGDKVLIDLAKNPPRNANDLPRPGLRKSGIDRFGNEIIKALHKATPVNDRPPRSFRSRRRTGRFLDPRARDRYEALRELRRDKAAELGIDPEVAMCNALLEELARLEPSDAEQARASPELNGWRGPLFADAIVAMLRSMP
jgi:ribonuclease D